MNKQMIDVMQRRRYLLQRITAQREQIVELSPRLKIPLTLLDQGVAAVRYARSHPFLIGGMVVLTVVRWRGVAWMIKNTWRLWNTYRTVTAFSTKISSRF